MATPVDFYFEFASPYGYLASLRIDDLAKRYGRSVTWRPVMLGAAFKKTGTRPNMHIPLKGDYLRRDVVRTARLMGVSFRLPPIMPMNSLAASRAYYWLIDKDAILARRLARAVYRAHWGEGSDVGSIDAVVELAEPLGVDGKALRAALVDPAIKDRLKRETQASIDRGVFGSPFMVVDDEPFWGVDKLGEVEAWLKRGGW